MGFFLTTKLANYQTTKLSNGPTGNVLVGREGSAKGGGFACPCIERELLRLGADPRRQNDLGLCWNDVAGHFVPER